MKKLLLAVLLSAAFSNLLAQKVISDPNVEKRTVESFKGLEVGTGIKLILTEGTTQEVAVSASTAEYRDRIVTKVENGILKIEYESRLDAINKRKESKNLRAYVSYTTLEKLGVSTGAEVEINGVLNSPSLVINANTGGKVNGEVSVTSLTVNQRTGSRITLTGSVETLDATGNTGSKFLGDGLKTNTCKADVNTGASVVITVQKELNVKANTGGYVKYKGGPAVTSKTGTGGYVSRI